MMMILMKMILMMMLMMMMTMMMLKRPRHLLSKEREGRNGNKLRMDRLTREREREREREKRRGEWF